METPYQYDYRLKRDAKEHKQYLLKQKAELETACLGMKALGRDNSECSFLVRWESEIEDIDYRLKQIEEDPESWEAF